MGPWCFLELVVLKGGEGAGLAAESREVRVSADIASKSSRALEGLKLLA